ncbi:Wzz/FepE/Etk N-terminal domain-containing protein [Xanthomonas maliensis]|uniref:Wzz/FepE/Etk N-terminal domain-containing protein n=1 Tax=Xanthomonas maliensis TaxID=1321368 RepID=UPI0003A0B325|nr:Wzz/FepE/Etk N-terminal domain-containing protein [Xanthomonas maliensis]KAB7769404.1 chain-length determining protein [Xanthomonas maliensis]
MNDEDEIYLIDLWRIVCREWRWSLATVVLVLGATLVFSRVARPQWEASASIQVGEIGPTPAGRDPKVEPFQRVIDRMKTRLFQDAVLEQAGIDLRSHAAALYRSSLKPDPDPYANLIGVSIRADSSAQARALANATVQQLQRLHGQTTAEALAQARQRLRGLEDDLRIAIANRDRLQQQVESANGAAGTQAQVLAAVLLSDTVTTIRTLQSERDDLLARFGARYTYQTSLAWPLYVPDRPAFPNPLMLWAGGGLGALALALLAAVLRNALRRWSTRHARSAA